MVLMPISISLSNNILTMATFFIKRTELHHTADYIKNVFSDIGVVEKVDFISKQNDKGQKYNGAIVECTTLSYSPKCTNMLKQLENPQEPFVKLFHNAKYFWLIGKHKENTQTITTKTEFDTKQQTKTISETKTETSINEFLWENDDRLDDNAMIYLRAMKRLVDKLTLEKELLEIQSEKKERASMLAEHEQMQQWLYAKDRDSTIIFKDAELEWAKEEFHDLKCDFLELKFEFAELLKSKESPQKKMDELPKVYELPKVVIDSC